jgi:hypothetical protein
MALTAQAGIFGYGPQAAVGTPATSFYRHKATLVDLGVMDDIRLGPNEIGNNPMPSFPYKAGYIVSGGVEMMPRLEDTVGWMLYALLGDVSSAVVSGTAYKHTFKPLVADPALVRWMTLKKYIPKKEGDASTDQGELYTDCKPISLTLTLPNDSPIAARWDFLGKSFDLVDDITAWTWQNTYEDWETIPIGCETGGYIKFTGGGLTAEELPVVNARLVFTNTPLDIRQEKVYGSPELEDITIIDRRMSFDVTVKWNNPSLYKAILTGQYDGTEWSSKAMTGQLDVAAVSGELIGVTDEKYRLEISAPEIMWQMNAPVALAAGQAVIMRFTGTALDPSSGSYATYALVNDQTEYVWPSASS